MYATIEPTDFDFEKIFVKGKAFKVNLNIKVKETRGFTLFSPKTCTKLFLPKIRLYSLHVKKIGPYGPELIWNFGT